MSKNFRINLDLKRPDCTPLNGFKQGDNLSVINGTILQDSTPYNLTGLTLRANFKLPDGTVKFQNVTLTNAIEGEFSITVLSSVLDKTGIVLADISVFNADKKITSSTFKMTVAESIYNDGAIAGEGGKDLLEQILENEEDRVNSEKIRKANEIVRIENEDVRKANEIVREDNESKRKIGYSKMDTRIDNLVLGQGSQTEVIDARLDGITNIQYPTLKARLDDTSNQLTQNALATLTTTAPITYLDNATDGIMQVDSIKGRTLQNEIVNGRFNNGTFSWFGVSSGPTGSNNICKFTAGKLQGGIQQNLIPSDNFKGHKLYFCAEIKAKTQGRLVLLLNDSLNQTQIDYKRDNIFEKLSGIHAVSPSSTLCYIKIQDYRESGWSEIQATNFMVIDLTQLFGAGNEPSKEWCDENLSYFDGIKSTGEEFSNVNLFDKSKVTLDAAIMSNGNISPSSGGVGWYVTDFISVKEGMEIKLNKVASTTSGGLGFYNGKTFVSWISNTTLNAQGLKVRIPVGITHIRASNHPSQVTVNDFTINQEDYKIEILSHGKNLCDNILSVGGLKSANGDLNKNDLDWKTCEQYILIDTKKQYRFSSKGGEKIYYFYYDSNKVYISYNPTVFNPPLNTKYVRLSFYNNNVSDIQCEDGAIVTPYEPYKEDKSEILLKSPHMGIPNGVVDEIVGDKLYKRVGKRVYQPGDENNPLFITDKINTYYPLAEPIITTINPSSLKSFKDGSVVLNNTIPPSVNLKYPTSISGRLSSVENTVDDTVDRTQKLEEGLFTTVAQTIENKQDLTTAKLDIGNLKTEVVNARNGKPNLKAEIDGLKQSIIQLSINVKDFGAKGDGMQDDTTLIQKAIDACFNSGGGWVLIPAGTYKTTASIQLKSKVKLIGAGTNSTIIKKSGVYNAINAGKDGDYVTNRADAVGLYQMQIDGANFGGHGVSFTHTHYYNIEDVIIENNGDRGLSIDYSYTGRIDGVEARRNKTNIWIYNQANAIYCTNLYSSTATEYGFYVGGCLGLFLNGITHEGTAETAINIAGYSADLTINGVYLESDEKDIQEYLIYAGKATGEAASKNITIENVGALITNCITGKTLYHVRYSTDCIKFKNIFTKISGNGDASTAAILTGGINSLTTNPITGLTVENFYVNDVTTSKTSKLIDFSGQVQSGTVKNVYSNKYNPTTSIEIRRQWAAPFGDFTVDCINRKQIFKVGATSNRPALAGIGEQYFDTNLDKIVVYTGSAWV